MSLATLELVLREDFTSDQDVLDLLGFNDGFNPAMEGWPLAIPEEDAETTPEALRMLVRSTSDDDLASVMQALKEKRKQAARYGGGSDRYGVWVRAQLENETFARQALLKRLSYQWDGSIVRPNRKDLSGFILGVERYSWEDVVPTEFTGSSVAAIGGTFSFNNSGGDIPSRLAQVNFEDNTSANMYKYWLGLRGTRHSATPANFEPVWNLRKAYDFGDDTTGGLSNSDATAEDSYKAVCDFGTNESMAMRVDCRVRDVAGYSADQRGYFKLLLRAKVGANTVVRVRRFTGHSASQSSWQLGQRVKIENTNWDDYDLGNISIPGLRLLGVSTSSSVGTPGEFHAGVLAERVSGSGDLDMDCFILIPRDEGFVHMSRNDLSSYTTPDFYGYRYADGRESGVIMGTSYVAELVKTTIKGGLPLGNGIGVLAAARNGNTDKNDNADIALRVYQRWESLRGADT